MNFRNLSKEKKYIILTIPIVFLIGTIFHFLYNVSNNNIIIGMFTPVNESVWEHCKMVLLPIILSWSLYYILNKNKVKINSDKWFFCCLISVITSIITIPMLYYFYTESFDTEVVIVNILILFIAITFGQLLGLHFYNHSNSINIYNSIFILTFIVLTFVIFTFNPPKIQLFMDPTTNTYGINNLV